MAEGIPGSRQMPRDEFVRALKWLAEVVERDDSAGGFLEYEWSENPGVYNVRAGFRFGNSEGQGSMRLIQEGM